MPMSKSPRRISPIRLLLIDQATAAAPSDELKCSWKVCTPDTVKKFSAVAYHFGREIHKSLNIAVGVNSKHWGGTSGMLGAISALKKDSRFAQFFKDWESNEEQVKAWGDGLPYDLEISTSSSFPRTRKPKLLPSNWRPRPRARAEPGVVTPIRAPRAPTRPREQARREARPRPCPGA